MRDAPQAVLVEQRGSHEGRIDSDEAFWEANRREARIIMTSKDTREGPTALAQKRAPDWTAS